MRPPKRGSYCGETISIQRKDRPPQHRLAPDRRVETKRPLTQHPPGGHVCLAPTPAILLLFAFRRRYSAGQRRKSQYTATRVPPMISPRRLPLQGVALDVARLIPLAAHTRHEAGAESDCKTPNPDIRRPRLTI
jgi:hypothetical protein